MSDCDVCCVCVITIRLAYTLRASIRINVLITDQRVLIHKISYLNSAPVVVVVVFVVVVVERVRRQFCVSFTFVLHVGFIPAVTKWKLQDEDRRRRRRRRRPSDVYRRRFGSIEADQPRPHN